MDNSIKGMLLSGLVFPGIGQIVLKRYTRGVLLIMTTFISFVVIVVVSVLRAYDILEKIVLEGGDITMRVILDIVRQETSFRDSFVFYFFLILIIVCWVVGIVDAYIIGKKMDKEKQLPNLLT